jgi:hypothetical protein
MSHVTIYESKMQHLRAWRKDRKFKKPFKYCKQKKILDKHSGKKNRKKESQNLREMPESPKQINQSVIRRNSLPCGTGIFLFAKLIFFCRTCERKIKDTGPQHRQVRIRSATAHRFPEYCNKNIKI